MKTLDIIIVTVLIAASVLYLGWLFYKKTRASKGKGCNHCS